MSLPSPSSKNPQHGVSPLHEPAQHIINSHPTPSYDAQDNMSNTLTELPPLTSAGTDTSLQSDDFLLTKCARQDMERTCRERWSHPVGKGNEKKGKHHNWAMKISPGRDSRSLKTENRQPPTQKRQRQTGDEEEIEQQPVKKRARSSLPQGNKRGSG
ncbi:hypothetical protein PABG_12196 [Paracoccidioides brasiliensis Pb03]|nr:hypothetical protein PABG_12196 [Paracoccidioides brasiliensis Pb03]